MADRTLPDVVTAERMLWAAVDRIDLEAAIAALQLIAVHDVDRAEALRLWLLAEINRAYEEAP